MSLIEALHHFLVCNDCYKKEISFQCQFGMLLYLGESQCIFVFLVGAIQPREGGDFC